MEVVLGLIELARMMVFDGKGRSQIFSLWTGALGGPDIQEDSRRKVLRPRIKIGGRCSL